MLMSSSNVQGFEALKTRKKEYDKKDIIKAAINVLPSKETCLASSVIDFANGNVASVRNSVYICVILLAKSK